MNKISIAVIGKAGHALRLISILKEMPEILIKFVYYHKKVDSTDLPITSNFMDLFSADAIIIASPTPTHAGYIDQLKNYNGYILVEKPVVSTEEDTLRFFDFPVERKKKIRVNYNFLYSKIAHLLENIKTQGSIGTPISLNIYTCHGLAHQEKYKQSWRSEIRESFGVMEMVGVHFINLSIALFGKIMSTNIECLWKADCKKDCPPDTVFLSLYMETGVCVNLFHSYAGPFINRILFIGTDGYWEYNGTEAKLYYPSNSFDENDRFTTPPVVRMDKLNYPLIWKESLSTALYNFIGVIHSSGSFYPEDFDRALKSMEPIFKARKSLKNKWIN